jgi:hypothetical protein
MNKIYIGFAILLLSMLSVSALETTSISYIQKVTYTPYCNTICIDSLYNDTITNQTINKTDCTSACYGVFNISLLFAGDDIPRMYEINTSSPLYKNGSDFIVPGVYVATLGNSSDVTGINEKIINLTSMINKNLFDCLNNNSELQGNMTDVKTTCEVEKSDLNVALTDKNGQILDLEKKSKQRIVYGIIAFVLGVIAVKWGEPYFKGRIPKRDPNESGKSPYEGQY